MEPVKRWGQIERFRPNGPETAYLQCPLCVEYNFDPHNAECALGHAVALLDDYARVEAERDALQAEKERLQRARIGDSEIIGREMCRAEKAESERDALARRVVEMERDIKEVLARAWAFDDKPHLLFSGVAALAKKHIEEPEYGREIVRLMDDAYENIRLWKQSALPVRD